MANEQHEIHADEQEPVCDRFPVNYGLVFASLGENEAVMEPYLEKMRR